MVDPVQFDGFMTADRASFPDRDRLAQLAFRHWDVVMRRTVHMDYGTLHGKNY